MLSLLARGFLAALALTVAIPAQAQRGTQVTRPPNIVLILMDDLGYGDLGSYGGPDAKTPHIDRLAREGVKLTDFYANGPSCSPTRTGFITGGYPQRHGIEWPLGSQPGDSARGLLPAETSLPRLLKSVGYVTGLIGKWHLGRKPEFGPNRHGFDEFWGFLGGAVDYYSSVGATGAHDLFHNDTASTHSGYLTDEITARAKSFIDAHRTEPFFLEVAYNATHWPFQPPGLAEHQRARPDGFREMDLERRVAVLREGTRADYVAMLEHADAGVGAILTTLDRLNLSRNTLVIFTSDNGGEWLSRNAPLFHRKFTLWEGGIRVPALIRWPARIPAGIVSRQVGITMDLTASILAAAGVMPPPSYRPDGVDLIPLLAGRRVVERTLFWRTEAAGRLQRAVRRGRWKYLRDGGTRTGGGHEFLFDLTRDVGERRDLTATHATMLPEFRKLLTTWEAEVDSSRAATTRLSTDAGPLGAGSTELVEAATRVVRFLRGELDFDQLHLANTVSLYLGREEGGTRRTVERDQLRERANWQVRSPSLSHTYSFVPPQGSAELTASVGRHRNCADYSLAATFPDLARSPHVGTTLRYGSASCLQTWNLTLVFERDERPPRLVSAVYDQPEW